MGVRLKIILGYAVIILITISIGVFFIFELRTLAGKIKLEKFKAVQELSRVSYLDNLAQFIKYYDEVLTQSARNYAFTGDKKWKDRYYMTVEDLDKKIKEAIDKGDDIEKKFFEIINDSNLALVKLEEESFSLVDNNKTKEAVAVLESKEYWDQKKIYSDGLSEYLNKRGAAYQDILVVSTKAVDDLENNIENLINSLVIVFIVSIIIGLAVVIFIVWYFSRSIVRPLFELKLAIGEIIKGNLDRKVKVNSKDEFKELADSFNKMAENLKESRADIENKVKERTAELEKLNKYMIGRELKMVELKKKIKDLENK